MGIFPALDEVVTAPRSSGSNTMIDSHRAEVGAQEVGSSKQSVPKYEWIARRFCLLAGAL